MKLTLSILPFLFIINSNAKALHTLSGVAVGYALGKAGNNPTNNTTTEITKNYNNNSTFRCFCNQKIRVAYNHIYCANQNGTTTDILFFQENNTPNIIVQELKTRVHNTQGCEMINN